MMKYSVEQEHYTEIVIRERKEKSAKNNYLITSFIDDNFRKLDLEAGGKKNFEFTSKYPNTSESSITFNTDNILTEEDINDILLMLSYLIEKKSIYWVKTLQTSKILLKEERL